MDRSRFLAGLIGPTLSVVALSLLLNRALLPEMVDVLSQDFALIFVFGILALLAGLAILLNHHVWRGWPMIITLFGWLAVVGGVSRILFPADIGKIAHDIIGEPGIGFTILAALVLGLGFYLSYQAFRRPPAAPPESQ